MLIKQIEKNITKNNEIILEKIYDKNFYNIREKEALREEINCILNGYEFTLRLFGHYNEIILKNDNFYITIDLENISHLYEFYLPNEHKIRINNEILYYEFYSQFGNDLMFEVNFISSEAYLTKMDKSFTKEESIKYTAITQQIISLDHKKQEDLNDITKLLFDFDLKKDDLFSYIFTNMLSDINNIKKLLTLDNKIKNAIVK